MKAAINSDGLWEMEWSLPSDECREYNTGAILKITDTRDNTTLKMNQNISKDCRSVVIIVDSNKNNSVIDVQDQQICRVVIQNELEECAVYSVQIIPEYDSFQGQIQSTEVIIPPKVNLKLHSLFV